MGVFSAGPKPEVGVVCSWFSTNQNLRSRTLLFKLLAPMKVTRPAFAGVKNDTRVHGPCCRAVNTGSVYRPSVSTGRVLAKALSCNAFCQHGTKFGTAAGVTDVITCNKYFDDRLIVADSVGC